MIHPNYSSSADCQSAKSFANNLPIRTENISGIDPPIETLKMKNENRNTASHETLPSLSSFRKRSTHEDNSLLVFCVSLVKSVCVNNFTGN